MTARLLVIALAFLHAGTASAQSDYDRHVVFAKARPIHPVERFHDFPKFRTADDQLLLPSDASENQTER